MPKEFNIIKDINIRTNDRVLIIGRTGSGKTFFVKNWLLPHYDKYVFWDVKHENKDARQDITLNTPKELEQNIKSYNKILYQPTHSAEEDFDDVCEIIFHNGDFTLYVDEASIISTATKITYWHNMIMTQGRSYNVGIINATQRPRIIHNTMISEAEHIFSFNLNLETDIYKIKQQTGDSADEIRYLPEHYFLYYSIRFNKTFLFKPVKPITKDTKEVPKLEPYRPHLKDYLRIINQ